MKRRNNVEVVGNPTRHSFNTITKSKAKKTLGVQSEQILIVSFGGSLGSEVLNENICEFIDHYVVNNRNLIHIHSTGRSKYDEVISKFPQLAKGRNTRIVPYIDDMPTVLTAADIAITRSGAITISELCHSKTPSILVPSPNVTANHQLINALHMQKKGAAILIEEKDLTPNRINDVISELINNTSKLKSMSNNAYKLYNKNTEENIQNSIKSMLYDK
jgi:UDP-N-acetylglucosamine--N-acetylmuramyl-(pentapeptide) pyrophosphoryl-undecaprenol N-acetylglucosamine transferase